MGRKRIRTKSGRLTAGERRRRVSAANLQPGEVIILDRSRRVVKGVRSKNSLTAELRVGVQFAVDTDVRKLLHATRVALAEHFQAKLRAGERPDGRGELPHLKARTLARNPGRPDRFGVLTGEMARRWLLLKITGGPLRASTRMKPWGGDGRNFMINKLLARGVDFQSIDGEAAEVIRQALEDFIRHAAPTEGEGVATPVSVPHAGGELPTFRR
jgi:hypothetical protein